MKKPCADESAPRLLGIILAAARRRPLGGVGLPEREILYTIDRVDRKGACAQINQ
jgi:hypothetical protein